MNTERKRQTNPIIIKRQLDMHTPRFNRSKLHVTKQKIPSLAYIA